MWDVANILWDLQGVWRDPGNRWNWAALVVDVGTILLPGVPAFAGAVQKGGKAAQATLNVLQGIRIVGQLPDNARVGIRIVQRLAEIGAHSEEGQALIRQLAELATYGPREGVVVLGRFFPPSGYKSYIEKATEMGGTYFSLPKEVWEGLLRAGIDPWEVNRAFLDAAVARGDVFFVEADLAKIYGDIMSINSIQEALERGGFLYAEIYYLVREKGYRVVESYLME